MCVCVCVCEYACRYHRSSNSSGSCSSITCCCFCCGNKYFSFFFTNLSLNSSLFLQSDTQTEVIYCAFRGFFSRPSAEILKKKILI